MNEPSRQRRSEPPIERPAPSSADGRVPDPDESVVRPTRTASGSETGAGRPLIERIGMVGIALVLAALFGGVAIAAFSGGEPFLGVMAAIGCLMTLWAGALTLLRG
jgi:hypothetical protein